MMYKTAISVLLLALSCAVCNGQSSFQGITPGTSTRDQVNRVLGAPLNTYGTIIANHTPPAGISKLEVIYGPASNVVSQIYVYLSKPVARQALIQKLMLPQQPDFKKTGENGFLHEFFGGQALLFLVYESTEVDSGVKLILYNSKEVFESILKKFRGEPAIPSLNANVTMLRFYSDDAQNAAYNNAEKRVYQDRFSKSQTARISWELDIQFPPPGRRIPYTIETNFYNWQGTLLDKQMSPGCYIEASWTTAACSNSKGWETPGKWPIGIYKVELLIDGQKVITGSFEVY